MLGGMRGIFYLGGRRGTHPDTHGGLEDGNPLRSLAVNMAAMAVKVAKERVSSRPIRFGDGDHPPRRRRMRFEPEVGAG